MAINYPIIETQIRLIRALQKGYVEALEAEDWQAADYRCNHLNKLCEGLYYLSQLLDKDNTISAPGKPARNTNPNSWVSSIRSTSPTRTLNHALDPNDNSLSSLSSEPTRYEWGSGSQSVQPPPIDEVWQ
ncbi:MAG TPA: hypothetical protein V6C85_15820 [Allocoleopsis sp.]